MNDMDIFDDIDAPDEGGLSRLAQMFERRSALDMEIEALKADLKVKEEELRALDEVKFPELFDEVGVTSFTVGNRSVKLEEKLYGSLPKEPEEYQNAMRIIKDNGGEALIKVALSVDFNKGEAEHADRTAKLIQEAGYNPVVKETIHAATLQKFARECGEQGKVIDLKALGLYQRRFIKVK